MGEDAERDGFARIVADEDADHVIAPVRVPAIARELEYLPPNPIAGRS